MPRNEVIKVGKQQNRSTIDLTNGLTPAQRYSRQVLDQRRSQAAKEDNPPIIKEPLEIFDSEIYQQSHSSARNLLNIQREFLMRYEGSSNFESRVSAQLNYCYVAGATDAVINRSADRLEIKLSNTNEKKLEKLGLDRDEVKERIDWMREIPTSKNIIGEKVPTRIVDFGRGTRKYTHPQNAEEIQSITIAISSQDEAEHSRHFFHRHLLLTFDEAMEFYKDPNILNNKNTDENNEIVHYFRGAEGITSYILHTLYRGEEQAENLIDSITTSDKKVAPYRILLEGAHKREQDLGFTTIDMLISLLNQRPEDRHVLLEATHIPEVVNTEFLVTEGEILNQMKGLEINQENSQAVLNFQEWLQLQLEDEIEFLVGENGSSESIKWVINSVEGSDIYLSKLNIGDTSSSKRIEWLFRFDDTGDFEVLPKAIDSSENLLLATNFATRGLISKLVSQQHELFSTEQELQASNLEEVLIESSLDENEFEWEGPGVYPIHLPDNLNEKDPMKGHADRFIWGEQTVNPDVYKKISALLKHHGGSRKKFKELIKSINPSNQDAFIGHDQENNTSFYSFEIGNSQLKDIGLQGFKQPLTIVYSCEANRPEDAIISGILLQDGKSLPL